MGIKGFLIFVLSLAIIVVLCLIFSSSDKREVEAKEEIVEEEQQTIDLENFEVDEDGNLLEGDDFEEARKQAVSVQRKLNDGEDFDTLFEQNNSDTAQSDDGYYFTEGDMVDEYYQAVAKMEEGAINDQLVYYKGYGWFIIEKLKLEDSALTDTSAYLNNSGDGDESTIKSAIGQQMVQDKLDGIIEDMKVETTDEYDKITAYNVNTYLPFNADAFVSNGSGSAGSAVGSAG